MNDGPVVVGVEDEAGSGAALRWAAAEAARRGVVLRIVHVWSLPVIGWSDLGASPALEASLFAEAAVGVVEAAEAAVVDQMGPAAPAIERVTPEGPAAAALVEASLDACLLVVGAHGRDGLAGRRIGSVAAACAHHATVPVAVIAPDQAGTPDGAPVVVGVDDSEGARGALRFAAGLAASRGVRLVVVHGWDRFAWPGPDGTLPESPGDVDARQFAEQLLIQMVEEVLERRVEGLEIETRAIGAPAATALLGEADGASVLVVGSRGRGGFARLLLGSVGTQCLHHAPCPVVVVPDPGRASPA